MTPETVVQTISPAPSTNTPPISRDSLWASRRPVSPAVGASRTAAFDARISLLITHPCADSVLVVEQTYGIKATGATREEALATFWQAFEQRGRDLENELAQAVVAGLGSPQKPELQVKQRELSYIKRVQAWEADLQTAKVRREEERARRYNGIDIPPWRKCMNNE